MNRVYNLITRKDNARTLCKKLKCFKLAQCQRQRLPVHVNRVMQPVDLEWSLRQRLFFVFWFNGGTPQYRLDPSRQDTCAERFGHIIVCTHLETGHNVRIFVTRGHHDHRNSRGALIGTQRTTKGVAIRPWQHQIQQNQIRQCPSLQHTPCAFGRVTLFNRIAFTLQSIAQQLADIRIIFDKQHALIGHRCPPAVPVPFFSLWPH